MSGHKGIAAVLSIAAGALAQQQDSSLPPMPDQAVRISISASGEIGFRADFKDSPGDVSITRAGADVDVAIPIEYAQLNLGFGYEHLRYDFQNATGFPTGGAAPFDNIDRATLSARFAQYFNRQWSYVVGGRAFLSAEEGADVSDSLGGLIYAAPRYSFNDNCTIGLGVVVASQFEDDILILPLFVLDWTFAEKWNLSNDGLGLELTYTPNDHWSFRVGGKYDYRDFRLDDQGPIPDGVGRESRVPVKFVAAYTPTKQITIEGGVGVSFIQSIEVLNSNGDSLTDQDIDPAPFFMLRLSMKF